MNKTPNNAAPAAEIPAIHFHKPLFDDCGGTVPVLSWLASDLFAAPSLFAAGTTDGVALASPFPAEFAGTGTSIPKTLTILVSAGSVLLLGISTTKPGNISTGVVLGVVAPFDPAVNVLISAFSTSFTELPGTTFVVLVMVNGGTKPLLPLAGVVCVAVPFVVVFALEFVFCVDATALPPKSNFFAAAMAVMV